MAVRLRLALLSLSSILTACVTAQQNATEALKAALPLGSAVAVESAERFPGGAVCGRYSAFDIQGFRRSSHDYVVTPLRTLIRASEREQGIYCSDRPIEALRATLGIDASAPTVVQAAEGLAALASTIDAYETARGTPPAALEDLLRGREPALAALPLDPWGNPYRYERGLGGRVKGTWKLATLGSDGAPGGSGEASDITRKDLPLVQHAIIAGR